MPTDKLSDNWLFQSHSKETIKKWVTQLRYFYFIRASGGHVNDGDPFKASFLYTDKEDLVSKMKQLGLPYIDEKQQGRCELAGHAVFVAISDESIDISISGTADGNAYEVSEVDVQVCLELEKRFDDLRWQL